jgi:tight adherence protein C
MAENRQQALRCEVRLFVQLLTMIMDVGLSTRQTLATIAREAPAVMPNLAEELGVVLRQIESGGDESEALRMLSQELDVPELTSILNILRQVERFGGGIREPLLETLERIEEQNKFRLQELVGKISGRMTLVMVGFFIPALLAFTAGPGFMAIIRALKNIR